MSNKSGTPISSLTEPMEYLRNLRNHLSESQRKELFDALREPELPATVKDAVSTLDEIIAHDVDLVEPVICRWLAQKESYEARVAFVDSIFDKVPVAKPAPST